MGGIHRLVAGKFITVRERYGACALLATGTVRMGDWCGCTIRSYLEPSISAVDTGTKGWSEMRTTEGQDILVCHSWCLQNSTIHLETRGGNLRVFHRALPPTP